MTSPEPRPLPLRRPMPRWAPLAAAVLVSILLGRSCAALVDSAVEDARRGPPHTALPVVVTSFDGALVDLTPGDERRGEIRFDVRNVISVGSAVVARSAARDPDLTDEMTIDVWSAPADGCAGTPGTLLYSGAVTALRVPTPGLAPQDGFVRLCFALRLPVPAGNEYQGATDDVEIVITPSLVPR